MIQSKTVSLYAKKYTGKIMDSMTELISGVLSPQREMTLTNILLAILIAYMGGILASLTPCVYPMIPITVSVVGGLGDKKRSWGDAIARGFAYVGGMAVVYSFLGVIAGISGKVFGTFIHRATGFLILGALLSLSALVMLEVLPFEPMVWWNQLKSKKGSHFKPVDPMVQTEVRLTGIFILGASSGFIAAPCTTPILTSILAFIAKTQSVSLGFILMLSFAFGLGTLLLVVAGFTGALQILPRSGKWLRTMKIASGLGLLVFADYLIYRAGQLGGFAFS